ncbi:MAG TPA: spherulation-specific family 4 protein [Candidatus Nitrosotalea sp.]|nr:spherulation-specific family 4 protein [Candidatus Nitrosotalea sp.]
MPLSKSQNNGDVPKMGLLVPLYSDPDATWGKLVEIKQSHPSIEVVAIINPCNGPSTAISLPYAEGVRFLMSKGVSVIGYVHTKYGSRNLTVIKSEIDCYKNWYQLDGILLDEMANKAGKEAYYADLTKHAKSQGMTLVFGNPGTDTIRGYVGTVDNLILYDNHGLPPVATFDRWALNFGREHFSFLSYGVASLDGDLLITLSKHVGYLYVTDQGPENPWNSLPSYLEELIEMMEISRVYINDLGKIQN